MDRSDAPRAERRRLTHVDRRGRPRMVDVSAKPPTARRAVAEAEVAVSAETLSLVIDGGGSQGRRPHRRGARRRDGRQAHGRAHPAVPPDRADRPRRDDHARPRRVRPADPGRGGDDRPDGRRDGGDDRRVGRRPDGLRHGQGRRAGRGDPRRPAALEDRRQERRVAPARGGRGAARGAGRAASAWPAGSGRRSRG